jgi:hypothetical protein
MLNAVGWRYFTLAQLSNGRAIILLCGQQCSDKVPILRRPLYFQG